MKRKQLFSAMAIILTTGGLVACGGGGSSDDSTTTTTPASKSFIGTVDGFGSVYVNGIKFETDGASYDVDDDSASDESDLAVGMKVKIEGSVNDDGVTGTADSIYYDDDVEGPIDSGSMTADATTKSFMVLGMAVMVDAGDTVFDGGATFDNLAEGDNVEVSGYFDGTQIVASRIEKQSDSDNAYEVKGTVTNYDGSTISLTLQNGASTSYPVRSGAESDLVAGDSGQFVEVKLEDTGSVLEATEIELDDDDLLDDNEDEVELYGILGGDYVSGFTVNDVALDLSGSIEYEPASLEGNLLEGMQVEVEGSMVDGVLIVDEIEAEAEDDVEIKALVSDVVATDNLNGTLTLDLGAGATLTVESNNSTLLEDDSSADSNDDGTFTLSELLVGSDFVEIEAYLDTSSELVASKIKRTDDSSETSLEGPMDATDAASEITLLGITYQIDGSTSFELDGATTDATTFFFGLASGDIVEVEDDEPDGTADTLSRDTESSDD
ncbi:MAG: DUF5666 domain-containing protein [Gammaproteobacteria bacterium]|nr:DUF5666 domain-containing protein [Gammaproteobacteria bacterium]